MALLYHQWDSNAPSTIRHHTGGVTWRVSM